MTAAMPRRRRTSSWGSVSTIAIVVVVVALTTSIMTMNASAFSTMPSRTSSTSPRPTIAIARTSSSSSRRMALQASSSMTTTRTTSAMAAALLSHSSYSHSNAATFVANFGRSLSALTATIAGGIFAGSLHAISGPDHLAALIPRCCGLPWHRALRVGVVWGLGHGMSATLLGLAGYAFKAGILGSHLLDGMKFGLGLGGGGDFDLLHHAGSLMELAIGISLVVIGLLGIKEAREWHAPPTPAEIDESDESKNNDDVVRPMSLSSAAVVFDALGDPRETKRIRTPKRAVLLNGILHGFSWDGAPSLAPAVAISTFRGSLTFLLSYSLGTVFAMAAATTVIGEGTRRAAGKLDRPNLPRDLSVGSSALAIIVGVVWCGLALR